VLRELEQNRDAQTSANRPVGPGSLPKERGEIAEGALLGLRGGVEKGPEEKVMRFPAVPAREGADDIVSLARRPPVEEKERVDGEPVLPAQRIRDRVIERDDAVAEAAVGLPIDPDQAPRAARARGPVLEALV